MSINFSNAYLLYASLLRGGPVVWGEYEDITIQHSEGQIPLTHGRGGFCLRFPLILTLN
jgi:hypothetical protein